jgi:hypothetical protein
MVIKPSVPALTVVLFALVAGCQFYEQKAVEEASHVLKVERMAFVGFRALPSDMPEKETVRSPLTGSVFMGGFVPEGIDRELTERVYELLKAYSVDLVPPEEAHEAVRARKGHRYGADERDLLREAGELLACDAVLAGHVYCWQERVGTEYAVSRPASVAFELALVRVADGSVIWKSRYDKTQASLSENILDLGTFLKGKGRWMTVNELAAVGISDVMDDFPLEKRD